MGSDGMLPNKKYNSMTIREPTPDGTAFITITEESPGKIVFLNYQIGKAGSTVQSYTYALAELCMALFARGETISGVIDLLADISSDRAPRLVAGSSYNRSGAEALSNALRKYLLSLDTLPEGEKKYPKLSGAR
jgi:hypothetical protein